ncbi:RIO1 family regulatory kinase/ATPase [Deinococcus sp. KNUC1210]|uniref:RIO1 family regulatory kinase/ATPase domain-containing protein n=1 Tax=Deinococcus sp. KNUC1210 TaxID=2917691 RepID=UPI00351D3C07
MLLDDLTGDPRQRMGQKKRLVQGRRRARDMDLSAEDAQDTDPTLLNLERMGHVTEVLGELKSGKEATVYLARGPRGLIALKIYRDLQARSFKNDAMYRAGRYIGDVRIEKAIAQRSARGLQAQQGIWTAYEYQRLWQLWNAGLNVPEPLVGPHPSAYTETSPAVLMRFIGDEEAAAPRLSEVVLTPEEARRAWQEALDGMAALLRLGLVHGDYSTYNLLWWENHVMMIDFPQVSDKQNPNFQLLLERDAASLSRSFTRHGVNESAEATLREVQKRARQPGPQPRVQLP